MVAHQYFTPGPHLYEQNSAARKRLLRDAFVMKEAEIPPISVYVSHGYVQQPGSKRHGERCTRYQSYLIQKNRDRPDATVSGYGDKTVLGLKKAAVSLQGVPD